MAWNGAPVAVKELSATTLDAASIGEHNFWYVLFSVLTACRGRTGGCQQAMYRLPMADYQRTSWRY